MVAPDEPGGSPPPSQPIVHDEPIVPGWRDRLELIARGEPLAPVRLAAAVAALAGLVVVGWLALRDPPLPVESTLPMAGGSGPAAATVTTATTAAAELVVHASGAVRNPGLYRLGPGARVADVIAAAGGSLDDADLDRVNLAAPVTDGSQLRVPRVGEPIGVVGMPGSNTAGPPPGPVDLNLASAAQLEDLPGIGPATAAAIIETRLRRPFRTVDDLLDVTGIGPAKLDRLRELVTV